MNYEILDHNIHDPYVTYTVALWEGKENDPATTVTVCTGTWRGETLEKEDGEAFDPDFSVVEMGYYMSSRFKPRPLVWEKLEVIKEGDREANEHRQADERMREQNGHVPYSWREGSGGVGYEQFLSAIDALAVDDQDEEAYKVIDAWRQRQLRTDERG